LVTVTAALAGVYFVFYHSSDVIPALYDNHIRTQIAFLWFFFLFFFLFFLEIGMKKKDLKVRRNNGKHLKQEMRQGWLGILRS
jgi:hypothetical protein